MDGPATAHGRTPRWWLAVYCAVGLAIYAPILTAWFVADDWDFLLLADRANNILVCFTPLLGRFLRPLEVLTYYVNYELFGLRPLPYHLTVVLVHIVNTWLVARLATRLGASHLTAFGAGLIFVVFAGHSEAVTWLGGAADAWLVLFLVIGLLLFAAALEADRAGPLMAAACLAFAAGLLAKETAAIAPALVLAFGGSQFLGPARAFPARRIVGRTLVVAAATAAVAAGYIVVRASLFGSVFGAYNELATSRGIMAAEARAFILRSFLPAGRVTTWLWVHNYDIAVLAAGAVVVGLMFWWNRQARPALAFLPAALAISLAPALPLTISLADTVSERYIYAPTAFACILMAWLAELLFARRRLLAAAVISCVVLVHAWGLVFANRQWIDAGRLGKEVMAEILDAVRAAPPDTRTLLLNVPDTVRGAYVIRGAFHNSFHLMARDVQRPEGRVSFVGSTASVSARDVTVVHRTAPREFTLSLDQGVFVEQGPARTADYNVEHWNGRGYAIAFNPSPYRYNVLYTSNGHVHQAGVVEGFPFGSLDIPADGAACAGASIRFSGWALSGQPGAEVVVERVGPDGRVRIGVAHRDPGARPDVSGYYRDFPDADRAGWSYLVPCSMVRSAGGRLAVRVITIDRSGAQTDLGTRTIVSK